jgi:Protein of unknown function (DUF2878)
MRERPDLTDVLINLVAFQAAWFALVLGAANGVAGIGFAAAVVAIGLHLFRSPAWLEELKLIAVAAVVGLLAESVILATGVVTYVAPGPVSWLPPTWLVVLWAVFATTMNVTFRPLRSWTFGAAFVGFTVVPLAYLLGAKLGGMTLAAPTVRSLSLIGLAWLVALPLLFFLAQRLDGWRDA